MSARGGPWRPGYSRGAEHALRRLPSRIASEVGIAVAELAAGDDARWRSTKKVRRPRVVTFSSRVGDYRIVFRLDHGEMAILAVLHRKDFERYVLGMLAGS